jgi:polysaccharide export outer membrane protein
VPPGGSGSGKFLIGPDDTVTLVALNVDEINKQWRVGGTGDLSLPMIGRVHVAGMTVEQLENELASRLQKYVLDPHVTVFVSEFRSQPVTVTGDVLTPGTTQIQGPKNLFQVLMGAGGANDKATTVKLARRTDQGKIPLPGVTETQSGDYSVVEMPIKDVTDVRTPAANLVIRPFDVVTVARDRSPKLVHIIGEIARPGAVELITQPTVSLLQLVAVSGGLTHTATPRKTRVIHLGPEGGELSTTVVNLKSIMAGTAKDVRLGPGDVVVVPSSAFKSYLETASLSAVTTGMYILQRF